MVDEKKRIRFGDSIFIAGLKIIYLGNILAINQPENNIKCSLRPFSGFIEEKMEQEDVIKSKEYFLRSPRIVPSTKKGLVEIDPPPNKKAPKQQPLILTIGPSLTMSMAMLASIGFSIYSKDSGNRSAVIPSMIVSFSMFLGAILWPILSRKYQKNEIIKEERLRTEKYKQYIRDMDQKLNEDMGYNRKVYKKIYPSVEVLSQRVFKQERSLWEQTSEDTDFLNIRLGKGMRPFDVEIKVAKERFSLEDDPLKKEAVKIQSKYKYMNNIPISISLRQERLIGFIGIRKKQIDLLKTLIIRLSSIYCYDEIKLAFLFHKKEKEDWNFCKWLPHSWTKGKQSRLVASEKNEIRDVLLKIKEIMTERRNNRQEGTIKRFLPYIILFVTDYEIVEEEVLLQELINLDEDLGLTIIFLYDKLGRLPNKCNTIIQYASQECSIYNKSDNTGKMQLFLPDTSNGINMDKYARKLAGIKVKEITEAASIPESLTFLGMYKAGKVEDLVIKQRWKESQSDKSLEAPLGIGGGNELFSLNIHEKYHGPHGLIAGTTGSGKSELIQSFILSLAVNYHPYDVSFVLIDYKGGGMADSFIGIPHVAGTITNLDGNQIKRSLASINSELKKRQDIFREYGVNRIDDYQKLYKIGKTNKPMPHLVIISDEFAELKSQEPEFMHELVSAARIGRSLGVHLILATQKPSGVVDDQIWSNTRFRVCLKVADRIDSNEMLKRADAASITLPGRAYVQVGNDEIFQLIQSGYSGGAYVPTDNYGENIDLNTITCIDISGNILYQSRPEQIKKETDKTQLKAVVEYIKDFAEKEHIKPLYLWMPPLPKVLVLEDLSFSQEGFNGEEWFSVKEWLTCAIGMYDYPEKQMQGTLNINIGEEGHVAIYGAPATGKTTFLQTLIFSFVKKYSPDILHIYILDFGSRAMSYYKILPHVGDVVFSDDTEKVKKLIKMLIKELNTRKRIFAEYGVGNLKTYMQISGKIMPALFVIIDNYSAFYELYPDFDAEMILIAQEGGNYGIYQIFTAAAINAIKNRIISNFKLLYTLQLNDKYDYVNIVGQTDGLVPENVKGRGLAKVGNVPLEYQTALAVKEKNDAERVKVLKKIFEEMSQKWKGSRAKNIPMVPEDMRLDLLIHSENFTTAIKNNFLPIGYDIEEAELISVDLKENFVFLIGGTELTGKTTMLTVIANILQNYQIWLVDNVDKSLNVFSKERKVFAYANSTETLSDFIDKLAEELVRRHRELKDANDIVKLTEEYPKIAVIIDGFENFYNIIEEDKLNLFHQFITGAKKLGINFFISFNSKEINKYKTQKEVKELFLNRNGVIFSTIENQSIFNINMSYQQRSRVYDAGTGYYIEKGKFRIIKTPYI